MPAQPTPAAAWRGYDANWTGYRTKAGNEFATQFFDAAATRRMETKARALGVSLNGLLMHTLAVATEPELEAGPRIWMMPVNLRGPVQLDRDTANQSGYLQLEISADAYGGVACRSRSSLRSAAAITGRAGRFSTSASSSGCPASRHVFKLQMARFQNRPFVGSFSNLGAWKGRRPVVRVPAGDQDLPGRRRCDRLRRRLALIVEAHASVKREARLDADGHGPLGSVAAICGLTGSPAAT